MLLYLLVGFLYLLNTNKTKAQSDDFATIYIFCAPDANAGKFDVLFNDTKVQTLSHRTKMAYKLKSEGALTIRVNGLEYETINGALNSNTNQRTIVDAGISVFGKREQTIEVSKGESYYFKISASNGNINKLKAKKVDRFLTANYFNEVEMEGSFDKLNEKENWVKGTATTSNANAIAKNNNSSSGNEKNKIANTSEQVLVSDEGYKVSYRISGSNIIFNISSSNSSPSIRVDVNQNSVIDKNVDKLYGETGNTNEICAAYLIDASATTACGGAPSSASLTRKDFNFTYTIPIDELRSSSKNSSISVNFAFWSSTNGFKYFPENSTVFSNVFVINTNTNQDVNSVAHTQNPISEAIQGKNTNHSRTPNLVQQTKSTERDTLTGTPSEDAKYLPISDFHFRAFINNRCIIKAGEKEFLIDKDGNIILDMGTIPAVTTYRGKIDYNGEILGITDYYFTNGMIRVKNNLKEDRYKQRYGFMDTTGKVVIPPIYKRASNFSEGVSIVITENNEKIVIDKTGKQLLNLTSVKPEDYIKTGKSLESFKRITYFGLFYEDKIQVKVSTGLKVIKYGNDVKYRYKSTKYGYADKTGKIVINPAFDMVRPFSEGRAAVMKNQKWGFIDSVGNIIVDFKYEYEPGAFIEGLASVRSNDGRVKENKDHEEFRSFDKVGFIDKSGKQLIDTTLSIHSTLSINILTEPLEEEIGPPAEYNRFLDFTFTSIRYQQYYYLPHFIDDHLVVESGKRYIKRLLNKNGGIIEVFDNRSRLFGFKDFREGFSEGLVIFVKQGLSGMMDKNGKVVISPVFKVLKKFREGRAYAECEKDGKITKGFINHQGRFVIVQKESKF